MTLMPSGAVAAPIPATIGAVAAPIPATVGAVAAPIPATIGAVATPIPATISIATGNASVSAANPSGVTSNGVCRSCFLKCS